MSSIRATLLCLIIAALGSTSAFAQNWPQPSKTPDTDVPCPSSGCPQVLNSVGKLTPGYPGAPLKTFTGRFLDSTTTEDYQGYFRTARAYRGFYAPAANRLYMIIGSGIFAYDANKFFTRLETGEALMPSSSIPVQRGGNDRPQGPEYVLRYDTWFYAENTGSGWDTHGPDGQQRMFYLDWDDQGYLYLATAFFGWGIVKDPGTNDGSFMPSQSQYIGNAPDDVSAYMVAVVKGSGGRYYALVSDGSSPVTNVFDVTDRKNPQRMTSVRKGFVNFAKDATMTRLAIATNDGKFEIYNTDDFVTNRGPIVSIPSTGGTYSAAGSDGTNFFGARYDSTGTQVITFAASGGTYNMLTPPVNRNSVLPSDLRFTDGYIVLAGRDTARTMNVYKVDASLLATPIDLTTSNPPPLNFFQKYYTAGGGQYVRPLLHMMISDGLVVKRNAKTYVIVDAFGLGDVYELRAGDSVLVQAFGTNGTVNAKNPTPATSVYGDPFLFLGKSTGTTALNLSWDFGNPEAAAGADPNVTTSTTDQTVRHQFSGVTSSSQLGARTVKATNLASTDRSTDGSLQVTLGTPKARFGVTNYSLLFTQPNASSAAPIVPEDRFFDASDGVLEGHWSSFTIDGVSTSAIPSGNLYTDVSVGTCGSHSVTFAAHYGPYRNTAGGPATFGSALNLPEGNPLTVNYIVRPFAAAVGLTASAASPNLTFTDASKVSTTAMTAAQVAGLTYRWSVINASGVEVTNPAPVSGSYNAIQPYVIAKTSVSRGMKVRLTLTATAGAGSGGDACSGLTTSVADSSPLNVPDPVVLGNCTSGNGSQCNFTAGSLTAGLDQTADGWTYSWSVSPSPNVITSSGTTANTFHPVITATGTYVVTLTVANNIGQAQATQQVTVSLAGSVCDTMRPDANIFIAYSGPSSGCTQGTSGSCIANEPIAFNAATFMYDTSCATHTYSWTISDGFTSTSRSFSHAMSAGSYTVSCVVSNGAQQITLTKSLTVGGQVQPPPPPPPPPPPTGGCPTMTATNVFIGVSGPQSGCTAAQPSCRTGENINFSMSVFGYDTSCATHTVSWNFGDGSQGSGTNPTHAFANDGPHTVSMTVSNGRQNFQASQVVNTSGGGGTQPPPNPPPGNGSCQTIRPGANVFIAYAGPNSGCTQAPGSPQCSVSEAVAFNMGVFGYDMTCASHTFTWKFGDNATGSGQSPTHAYATGGVYHVSVHMSNGSASADITQDVNVGGSPVGQLPHIDFTISPMEGVANGYKFVATTDQPNAVTQWSWDYGDGETASSGATHTHIYPDGKTYTIKLTAPQFPNVAPVTHTVPVQAPRRRSAHH